MFGRTRNTAANGVDAKGPRDRHGNGHMGPGVPFRFGAWLRLHGVDLITMALMGALGLGIYEARKCPDCNFHLG